MIGIFFGFIAIFSFVIFVPGVLDFVLKYGPYFLATLMGGGMIYVSLSYFSAIASVGADEVLAIFLDVNNKDIHLLSARRTGKMVGRGDPDRSIQHYFITAEGKRYYHELFSHALTSVMGSGNYEGYTSLKECVLDSPVLKQSLEKFSVALKQPLALGERLNRNNDHLYIVDENHEIRIDQSEKLYRRQLTVVYVETKSKRVVWSVKI